MHCLKNREKITKPKHLLNFFSAIICICHPFWAFRPTELTDFFNYLINTSHLFKIIRPGNFLGNPSLLRGMFRKRSPPSTGYHLIWSTPCCLWMQGRHAFVDRQPWLRWPTLRCAKHLFVTLLKSGLASVKVMTFLDWRFYHFPW